MAGWIPYNTGLPNVVIDDMEIFYPTGKLRAATYARGVWETGLYTNPAAAPAAAFGTLFSPACISTALQFTDYSGNTPTSWNWSFPGGSPATATVQNPSITYATAGVYTVTLISANGNGTSTPYSATVSVVNAPTVAPVSNSLCLGTSANISVGTNGNMVTWSTGQQGFNIGVSPTVTSVYSFTASLGACNTVGSSTMNVLAVPETPTIIVGGNILTTTVVAQFYQWYLNGSILPGETSSTIALVLPGQYLVWVANGTCDASSDPVDITDIGLRELTGLSGLSVGPNPVKDVILLSLKNGNNEDVNYEIQNNLGQIVLRSRFKTDNNKEAKINVQFLAAGIYYLNLQKGESKNSYKFIKQ
jgi:PKD repeat protein